jgi:hypothetical protein
MMDRIHFRCPPELLAAARKNAAAEGLSVNEYARKALEEMTGVHVEVKLGLAGADKKTQKRVQKMGVAAIKKLPKGDSSNGK